MRSCIAIMCCALCLNVSIAYGSQDKVVPALVNIIMQDLSSPNGAGIFVPAIVEGNNVDVTWYFPEPSQEYRLEQLSLSTPFADWQHVYTGNEAKYNLPVGQSGEFIFRVAGCFNSECNEYIESQRVSINVPMSAPSNVSASHTDGVTTVTWTPAANNPTVLTTRLKSRAKLGSGDKVAESTSQMSYQVFESVDNAAYTQIDVTTTASYQHQVHDQLARSYKVSQCSEQGCSGLSPSSNQVLGKEPTNAQVQLRNDGIHLSWQPVSNVAFYNVWMSVNGGNWILVESISSLEYQLALNYEGRIKFRVDPCDAQTCHTSVGTTAEIDLGYSQQCEDKLAHINTYTDYTTGAKYIRYEDATYQSTVVPSSIPIFKTSKSVSQSISWKYDGQQLAVNGLPNGLTSGGLEVLCKWTSELGIKLSFIDVDNLFEQNSFTAILSQNSGGSFLLERYQPIEITVELIGKPIKK